MLMTTPRLPWPFQPSLRAPSIVNGLGYKRNHRFFRDCRSLGRVGGMRVFPFPFFSRVNGRKPWALLIKGQIPVPVCPYGIQGTCGLCKDLQATLHGTQRNPSKRSNQTFTNFYLKTGTASSSVSATNHRSIRSTCGFSTIVRTTQCGHCRQCKMSPARLPPEHGAHQTYPETSLRDAFTKKHLLL